MPPAVDSEGGQSLSENLTPLSNLWQTSPSVGSQKPTLKFHLCFYQLHDFGQRLIFQYFIFLISKNGDTSNYLIGLLSELNSKEMIYI